MKEENDQFEHFVRGVYPTAVRTAYLITGSPEEAMDLAQEAFIRAFTRWGRVSRLDRPDRWVQRVVTNLAISWRRRQGARLRALNRLGGQGTNPIEWDEEPDAGAIAALQRLPLAQRSVLVLRYCLDWSTEEVATALRKRPGTVRALAWQGLDRLRRELQDQGGCDGR